MFSTPAIGTNGAVYFGSNDKKLYAISGKTGIKLWEFESEDTDGTVYVGSGDFVRYGDKKLYAIKTDSTGLAKSPWPMRGQTPNTPAARPLPSD